MALYIVLDTNLSGNEAIRESMRMMDGYKWDYFVFQLSFLGWMILAPLTLGILYIWLLPYYSVAEVIYYERLREKTGMVTTTAAPVAEEKPVAEEVVAEPAKEESAEKETDPIDNKE